MSSRRVLRLALIAAVSLGLGQSVIGRGMPVSENQIRERQNATTAGGLVYCIASHNVGKISLAQTNYGTFGTGFVQGSTTDCFTGANVPSCEYPKGSGTMYVFAASFWIGAVVGRDTLVSVGSDGWQNCREMNPEESPIGDMVFRSISDPSKPEFEGAKSEQDLISVYTDRYTTGVPGLCATNNDPVNGIGHRPLNIEITERSYAWSYSYAEDFVLFDYTITNGGSRKLDSVYMGVYVDADVGDIADNSNAQDDITGFVLDQPTPRAFNDNGACPTWRDTINLAWISDNDGDLGKTVPVPNVTGTRVVRTPSDSLQVSYNWWIGNASPTNDFGPQWSSHFRDLGTGGTGTPEGDRNKYFYLHNGEFDYDQIYTCRYALQEPWAPVRQDICQSLSKGFDTRYLLSFGPFTMQPGDNLPLSFAYVGGEGFHTDRDNDKNLGLRSGNYDPDRFYSNLNFKDFTLNAVWASWIYDNPGVSTRDSGFAGKFRVCSPNPLKPDTIYYTGDGEPDFRGAAPPPAPTVWLYPQDRRVRIRFNGFRSETTKDVFSRVVDFEGYRVYMALDDRAASYSVLQSFDIEDYNKWTFDPDKPGGAGFELKEVPFTYAQLDTLYSGGTLNWDPLQYTATAPFHLPGHTTDSIFYFTKQDYNQSRFGIDTKIEKTYPGAPKPDDSIQSPEAVPDSLHDLYLTDDNQFKYYEYQMFVDDLLPTIPYYFNVTAFDFGSPSSGLGSLESSPTVGAKSTYAIGSYARGTAQSNQVFVFPNPYRVDGGYQGALYEGRDAYSRSKAPDRQRRVRFANVPLNCTIKIFTVDGDLVKEIKHPDNQSPCQEDPTVTCWDLITRNTQLAVSGLYYWTVEDDKGNVQIGKLVLIM
jgi:hypothetical protein